MSKFLVSIADVRAYDLTTQDQLFQAKALVDSAVEVTLANTPVRAGRGNSLKYLYWHTAEMKISVVDAQWNLDFIALNTGKLITSSSNLYSEESVTLVAGVATVTGTPLAIPGATPIYGWVTMPNGDVKKVTFTGQVASAIPGATTEKVCVRYWNNDSSARQIVIPANIVPKQMRLEMDIQVADNTSTSNIVGKVELIVPTAIASGAFTLNLKPDAVSTTPLNLTALATSVTVDGCNNDDVYAYLVEQINGAVWYQGLSAIAVADGDFTLDSSPVTTKTLTVWGVPSNSNYAPFIISNSLLDFTSSDPTKASAGLNTGLITGVAAGDTIIHVTPTAVAAQYLDAYVTCSVTA